MSHFGRMGSCPSWGPGWEAFVGVSPQARGYDVSSGECDSCPFTGGKVLEALGFSGCRCGMNLVSCGGGAVATKGMCLGKGEPRRPGWFMGGKVAWESRAGSCVEEKGLCGQMR